MAGILEQLSKGLFGLAPIPAPNGVFGQVLDSAAQWGRGVQDKAATLADLLKKPLPMDGRANFLPYQDTLPGSVMNQRQLAVPGVLAGALNALTAPARAAQQEYTVDENGNIVSSFNAPEEAQNVAMSMLGGGGVASRGAPSGVLGMNVWHGSPHKFDKFDMSKIGTGEGAQAYGHGLYLAESPEVAKSYSALGHIKGNVSTIGGKDINTVYSNLENTAARLPPQKAAAEYEKLGMLENLMNNQTPSEVTKFAQDNGYSKATIDWFNSQVVPKYQGSGNLYKVDLPDEHIAKMLDWDKPLSQQAPEVRAALDKISNPMFDAWKKSGAWGHVTGDTLYKQLSGGMTRGATAEGLHTQASKILRDAGIPGIRYLDGGSRAGGKGTSNFVVFDDSIPKIIGRE